MENCVVCGAPTDHLYNDTPICIECDEKRHEEPVEPQPPVPPFPKP
jgi:hypothetical protein